MIKLRRFIKNSIRLRKILLEFEPFDFMFYLKANKVLLNEMLKDQIRFKDAEEVKNIMNAINIIEDIEVFEYELEEEEMQEKINKLFYIIKKNILKWWT